MRNLTKDVSISELMHMREEGMSNKEIAERLDVSYITILRLIGKQPAEMTAAALHAPKPKASKPAKVQASPKPASVAHSIPATNKDDEETVLLVDERVTRLVGMFGNYEISDKEKEVHAELKNGTLILQFDELEQFVKELSAISKNLQKFAPRMEGF